MNFQDRSAGSVQSLLAQLRAAQDESTTKAQPPMATGTTSTSTKRPRHDANLDSGPTALAVESASASDGTVPSSKQLQDLLSSLGQPSSKSRTRTLIEPFGPISTPSSIPTDQRPTSTTIKDTPSTGTSSSIPVSTSGDVDDFSRMSFTKALPIISSLLSDPQFKAEVKRMKVDQDTLERRLWAKGEKVKVEHEKTTRTDKEIARITGKPISPTKQREWKSKLSDMMDDFYRHGCLPAIDGLAKRHKERLEVLGVPGLGGEREMGDPKARERVRRIMDVLEGSLDE